PLVTLSVPTRRSSDLVVHDPLEVHEGAVDDPHLVTALEHRLRLWFLRAGRHLTLDFVDLILRERNRFGAGAYETGHLRCRPHEIDRKSTRLNSSHVKI